MTISSSFKKNLITSNVGLSFHEKTLGDSGSIHAPELAEWVKKSFSHDMSCGRNKAFLTEKAQGYDLTILTVRGMIAVTQKPIWVYSLSEILNPDILKDLYENYPFLCITHINPREIDTNGELYRRFESLMYRYQDRNLPHVLQIEMQDLSNPPKDTLMSPMFADRINDRYLISKVD